VITQIQRLGHATEAVGVLGDPGDGQQLVHAAHGQHEPVVAQLTARALGVLVCDLPRREIDSVHLAEHEPYAAQRARKRDRHPAGLQHTGGDLGQQRQIEEVVVRVDEHDLRRPPELA
jgi:hypothetical protein